MLSNTLANFYERDIRKLIDEINAFRDEANLWKISGSVKNPAGNLVLHLTGGTNYLIGNKLGGTGYVRHRDEEFTRKNVPRAELVAGLEALAPVVRKTIMDLSDEGLSKEYPMMFDDMTVTNDYLLVQLLAHWNYHLGQVNYLRRSLE